MTWWRRWRASRIALRLLAFNILVVFVPIVGVLYLDVYEDRLLEAQERAMVQQGRILAAAVGSGDGIDPDEAMALLRRLGRRTDARLRIFDRQGALIADSSAIPGADVSESPRTSYPGGQQGTRADILYRVGAALAWTRNRVASYVGSDRTEPDLEANRGTDRALNTVVIQALRGRYGAVTRPTRGQRSVTLYSGLPAMYGDDVVGAVVVSQSSFRILQALYDVRLRIFRIVVASLAVAAVLTMIAATTIVRPLMRLRRAATSLAERRTALLSPLPGVQRRDEIGELARDLQHLTGRLNAHIGLLEGFAADVAHEFKNPLAGIRSAAETIDACDDPSERSRFVALMIREVGRLERLVSGLRDLARVDRHIEESRRASVDVTALVRTVTQGVRVSGDRSRVAVHGESGSCRVAVDAESLAQVFDNLLTNAISLSPEDGVVDITVTRDGDMCAISVADRGPGIPEAHLSRVFDRFFTYRPTDSRREHLGLGLAIAKRIVEGHGGTIAADNRDGGGAIFEVRLPVSSA